MTKLTFAEWMKEVDAEVWRKVGLSYEDLPDINYRDLYDDGVSPKTAARKAIRGSDE